MAKAKVELICATCGEKFIIDKTCYNRKEADNWEAYMSKRTDLECTKCYAERMRQENHEKAMKLEETYELPVIIGVSEKQTAYATKLRNNHIASYGDKLKLAYKIAANLHAYCRAYNKKNNTELTSDEYLSYALKEYRIEKEYKLLSLSTAGKIIDLLK